VPPVPIRLPTILSRRFPAHPYSHICTSDPVRPHFFCRPEALLVDHLLVPPVPIRPSVMADPSIGSNEDDLTVKMSQIVTVNNVIRGAIEVRGARFPSSTPALAHLSAIGHCHPAPSSLFKSIPPRRTPADRPPTRTSVAL
jgi:hypothetical protein